MGRNIIIAVGLLCVTAAFSACGDGKKEDKRDTIVVSVAPLKYVADRITGGDFNVEVLVPEGASPETYSPTPRQMISVENASYIFVTNLIDFERELVRKLPADIRENGVTDVSRGIKLLYGTHHHLDADAEESSHGADPHIWTSPAGLKQIASTIYNKIAENNPDSLKYTKAYTLLMAELEGVETEIRDKLNGSGVEYFIIYHPALSYYARDFGIEQMSIEDEGKEPSAAHMGRIVERASRDGVKTVMYQREFPRTTVETLAKDIGAVPTEVNPLAENIVGELLRITDIITR